MYLAVFHFRNNICTSRGCWGNCIFCSFDYKKTKRINSRNLKNVREEIELLINKYQQNNFFFSEPNFLYSKSRTKEFINMLKKIEGIKSFGFTTRVDSFLQSRDLLDDLVEFGCKSIELGIESGSDSQLKRFDKGTTVSQNSEAVKIILELQERIPNFLYCIDLILFDPYLTVNELSETIQFMIDNDLNTSENENAMFNGMYLFQGTAIRKMAIHDKLAFDSPELPYYNFKDDIIAKIYSYIVIFLNTLHPLLKNISHLYNELIVSNEYNSTKNEINRIKAGKLFYKRDSVVFNYFKEIIETNGEYNTCQNIYSKYKTSITKMNNTIVDIIKHF